MLSTTIWTGFKRIVQTKLRPSAHHCQTVLDQCIIKYKGPLYRTHPLGIPDFISKCFKSLCGLSDLEAMCPDVEEPQERHLGQQRLAQPQGLQ